MAHRSYYTARAFKHEKAARHAKSATDREGHSEVARGYRKLSHGGHGYAAFGHVKGKSHPKKHARKGHRQSAKARAASLRNLKKARRARKR